MGDLARPNSKNTADYVQDIASVKFDFKHGLGSEFEYRLRGENSLE